MATSQSTPEAYIGKSSVTEEDLSWLLGSISQVESVLEMLHESLSDHDGSLQSIRFENVTKLALESLRPVAAKVENAVRAAAEVRP